MVKLPQNGSVFIGDTVSTFYNFHRWSCLPVESYVPSSEHIKSRKPFKTLLCVSHARDTILCFVSVTLEIHLQAALNKENVKRNCSLKKKYMRCIDISIRIKQNSLLKLLKLLLNANGTKIQFSYFLLKTLYSELDLVTLLL